MNYLTRIATLIGDEIPAGDKPEGPIDDLLRLYAVLALVLGDGVTAADVHDAWVAWMSARDDSHEALVPFDSLDSAVARQDAPFVAAIRAIAAEHALGRHPLDRPSAHDKVRIALTPNGRPRSDQSRKEFFELYRMMVSSSESLVNRRQGLNTFFLTMNGLLLTAMGVFVRGGDTSRFQAAGILILAIVGAGVCMAWRNLIISFGQLNKGKFAIINRMEQDLAASIFVAEWEALEQGNDPKVYRSFTSREILVPIAFGLIYLAATVLSALVTAGVWHLGGGS